MSLTSCLKAGPHRVSPLLPVLVHRGFCYFNSVAIAAKLLQQRLSVSKTLIVDWVSGRRERPVSAALGVRVWGPQLSRNYPKGAENEAAPATSLFRGFDRATGRYPVPETPSACPRVRVTLGPAPLGGGSGTEGAASTAAPHLSGRPLPGRTRGCARPSLPVAAPSPSLRGCPACAGLACFPMSRRCHLTPSQPRKAGWLKLSPDSTKRCRALRPGVAGPGVGSVVGPERAGESVLWDVAGPPPGRAWPPPRRALARGRCGQKCSG